MKAVLSYLLAVGGVAVIAFTVISTFESLQYRDARTTLINLLRSNPNHAEMLCRNVTGNFFAAVGAAIKTGAMAKSRDPTVVAATSRPAFDAAGMGISAHWKQLLGRCKLGVMAAGGGLAIALSGGKYPILLFILAGAAGLGFLWLFVHKGEVERTIVLARAEILPEVDRAFVEGRYIHHG